MTDFLFWLSLLIIGLSILGFIYGVLSDEDQFMGGGAIAFGIGMVMLIGVAVYADVTNKNRLRADCLADGKKEYECYHMLKQDVVPVFIPIPMGR